MVISNHNSIRVLFDKIASVLFYLKNILIFQHWKCPAQGTGTVPIVSAHFQSLWIAVRQHLIHVELTSADGSTFAPRCLYTRWAKKRATDSWPCFYQILTDLNIFSLEDSLGKFAVKRISKIPPHLAYVATLPCETLTSAKQAINDKLQREEN